MAVAALAAGVAAALALMAAAPAEGHGADAAPLSLHAAIRISGSLGSCPGGTAPSIECIARQGQGSASGLGQVSESYLYEIDSDTQGACPGGAMYFRAASYPVQLVIVGKGTVDLLVQSSPECLVDAPPNLAFLAATQTFAVTGGSGQYAGASGGGTVSRVVSQTSSGHAGTETWEGTLAVPGFEFDVTPPVLSGTTGRSIRAAKGAKSAVVRFAVAARDDRDGPVAATCSPRSGSRFPIGRTSVTCSASDSSGNTATATFTVTVRRRR